MPLWTPNPKDATRKLVHRDQSPMCSQGCGFATEQIAAPQTDLHVAEKREPRWPPNSIPAGMNAQDTANNILVDLDAESNAICCATRGQPS
jgi:hypothetical protein